MNRPFSEKLVVLLGFYAGVQGVSGSAGVPPCSSSGLTCNTDVNEWASCPGPTLLEQIGPPDLRRSIYKPADGVEISLGMKEPETFLVPLKYKELERTESNLIKAYEVYVRMKGYVSDNCKELGILTYGTLGSFNVECPKVYESNFF